MTALRDDYYLLRDARSWARRTRQPLVSVVRKALEAYLHHEQTPHCPHCGSSDVLIVCDRFGTGVFAPDGAEEKSWEEFWQCGQCRTKTDIRDMDAMLGRK